MFVNRDASGSKAEYDFARGNFGRLIADAKQMLKPYQFDEYCKSLWFSLMKPTEDELSAQESAVFAYMPLISVIIPVCNPAEEHITALLESCFSQTYRNYEVCIVDGASREAYVRRIISEYKRKEPDRLRYIFLNENKGISENSNIAIHMSRGEYFAFVDHDDMLAPNALYEVADAINRNPSAEVFFTDHYIEKDGNLSICIKPNWNYTAFINTNYIVHLVAAKREAVYTQGLFDKAYDGYQDTDLFYKLTESAASVVHIPKPLYLWRLHKNNVSNTADKELINRISKKSIDAQLERVGYNEYVPFVSVALELPDDAQSARELVLSVLGGMGSDCYEVIVIYKRTYSSDLRLFINTLRKNERFLVLPCANGSACSSAAYFNMAAAAARGEYVLFINKDVTVLSNNILPGYARVVGYGKKYAAAGCTVFAADETGARIYRSGAEFVGHNARIDDYFNPITNEPLFILFEHALTRDFDCSSVVRGCVLINKEVFDELGGFDELFAECLYVTDFCVRAIASGYQNTLVSEIKISRRQAQPTNGFYNELELFKNRYKDMLNKCDPMFPSYLSVKNYIDYGCPLDTLRDGV